MIKGQLEGPGCFFEIKRIEPTLKFEVSIYSQFKNGVKMTLSDHQWDTPLIASWRSENLAMIYFWLEDHKEW